MVSIILQLRHLIVELSVVLVTAPLPVFMLMEGPAPNLGSTTQATLTSGISINLSKMDLASRVKLPNCSSSTVMTNDSSVARWKLTIDLYEEANWRISCLLGPASDT